MPIPYLKIAPFSQPFQTVRLKKCPVRVGPRQGKERKLIKGRLGIADPLHIGEVVVVEVRLGSLGRAEMHKDGPHAPVESAVSRAQRGPVPAHRMRTQNGEEK